MNIKLNRRQLLTIIAATLSGFHPDLWAAYKILTVDLFENFNIDMKSLSVYANLYLDKHPDENNRKNLEKLIFESNRFTNTRNMKKYLNLRIKSDFRNGRTVNLDGWILSETEVRLWCILYVLLSKSD